MKMALYFVMLTLCEIGVGHDERHDVEHGVAVIVVMGVTLQHQPQIHRALLSQPTPVKGHRLDLNLSKPTRRNPFSSGLSEFAITCSEVRWLNPDLIF